MKNTFIEELKKYERKALDSKLTRSPIGKHAASANLRLLIEQVVELKTRMSAYRPILSDDIVVAFESLLWLYYLNILKYLFKVYTMYMYFHISIYLYILWKLQYIAV